MLQHRSDYLYSEKLHLILTIIAFDFAYLARAVLAATLFELAYEGKYPTFWFDVITILPSFLLDGLPILLVVWKHNDSFKR